jgi:sporulation protein YlmC with PRC-barrel domain
MTAMSSKAVLTENDEGKRVINSRGDEVGRVIEVKQGIAHIDPDPGITEKLKSKLGWGDEDDTETYRLDEDSIEAVTSNEIRLRH